MTADAQTTLSVTVEPQGLLSRLGAQPVVRVDSREHPARWGEPVTLAVQPGDHRAKAFYRYRGSKREIAPAGRTIAVGAGEHVRLVARVDGDDGAPTLRRV
ncbi:hypothetical protein HJ588_10320 [Flexivirga sp. ID2601S]|uniref:Uncharacterized protein n=1 Tax=Flexivirga aerilata TaxID=1656889 RepID=A0A849AGU6_9MICO|nr:hypothetical protein [Flexivirga aerilata]NNG39665.1 hypothetical protein [Flexivirga aerilata]